METKEKEKENMIKEILQMLKAMDVKMVNYIHKYVSELMR